ncbi:SDR family oxidoreductase [Desulfoplanes sp. PS50]|jgi:NAD(P)-dependent dehydrogenase (short-subunit alcohol dehydrogenase family)
MKTIKELMDLSGRVALVTGGAGNIGKACCKALVECGAEVAIVDIAENQLISAVQEIEASGSKAKGFVADMGNEISVRALPEKVVQEFGNLDIIVNSAAFVGTSGLTGWVTPFENQTTDTWRAALEVNLTACFELVQSALPYLKESGHASVVNIASTYGVVAPDWSLYEGTEMGNPAAYAASKGGLIQLTRWLSTTLAPEIRVNAISPGGIWRNQPEVFVKRYEKKTPLQRMGTEEDMVGALVYLASDLSRYVTGQNLMVDGGWTAW